MTHEEKEKREKEREHINDKSKIGPELLVSKTLILGRFYQFRKLKYALFSQVIR